MPVINIKLLISSFKSYCSVYFNVQFWSYTILHNFAITLYMSEYFCIYMYTHDAHILYMYVLLQKDYDYTNYITVFKGTYSNYAHPTPKVICSRNMLHITVVLLYVYMHVYVCVCVCVCVYASSYMCIYTSSEAETILVTLKKGFRGYGFTLDKALSAQEGEYNLAQGGEYNLAQGGEYNLAQGGEYNLAQGGEYNLAQGGEYNLAQGGEYNLAQGGEYNLARQLHVVDKLTTS